MKTLSLPLVASAMLLAAPTLCCAAPAITPSTQVIGQEPQKNIEKTEKKDSSSAPKSTLDEDEDDFDDEEDDEDLDDEEDFNEEAISAPYPYGELKLEEGVKPATPPAAPADKAAADKSSVTKPEDSTKPAALPTVAAVKTAPWKAELPGKGFTIRSEWDEKPEFQNAARPDGKPQGAATLAMQQISEQEQQPFSLYVLMYIYDPETVGIAMTSPEKVIEQLITAPAEEAKQYGFVSTITDLPSTQIADAKQLQDYGVLKDVRKKVGIGQQDKTLYSQFYRLLIGKDFVVLGLVLGGEDGLEKKAQNFFDHISLSPNKTPAVIAPAKPAEATPAAAPAPAQLPIPAPEPTKATF